LEGESLGGAMCPEVSSSSTSQRRVILIILAFKSEVHFVARLFGFKFTDIFRYKWVIKIVKKTIEAEVIASKVFLNKELSIFKAIGCILRLSCLNIVFSGGGVVLEIIDLNNHISEWCIYIAGAIIDISKVTEKVMVVGSIKIILCRGRGSLV
jgi:hypothetical protein